MMQDNKQFINIKNQRDSSLSNNNGGGGNPSNPSNGSNPGKQQPGKNVNNAFYSSNYDQPGSLGQSSSINHFPMNNFMPSNLTSALYNQVSQGNKGEYSYDINLSAVNKSLNEYNIGPMVSNANNMMNQQ